MVVFLATLTPWSLTAVTSRSAGFAIPGPRPNMAAMEVILASRSPRRLMLLQAAGLAVEVRPSHIDETPQPGESVADMVDRLCLAKARACQCEENSVVIAADTLVAIDDMALGQPRDLDHAAAMIRQLAGREHAVLTGVCVRLGEHTLSRQIRTAVRFREIGDDEIACYLQHNDVLDKAGAYAVQGGAATFIEAIEGPLDNVIGLPVRTTLNMLAEIKLLAGQPS